MKFYEFYKLPGHLIIKIKRKRFQHLFGKFGYSGIGSIGYGDGCKIEGHKDIYIGDHSWINGPCELFSWGGVIRIGNNVHFQPRSRITCGSKIIIGDDVLAGPEVVITNYSHGIDASIGGNYISQPCSVKDVVIGNGVFLGQRSYIMPGVTIGERCVIGANSVVTKDVPPYCMVAGIPAKVIKKWNFEEKRWEKVP